MKKRYLGVCELLLVVLVLSVVIFFFPISIWFCVKVCFQFMRLNIKTKMHLVTVYRSRNFNLLCIKLFNCRLWENMREPWNFDWGIYCRRDQGALVQFNLHINTFTVRKVLVIILSEEYTIFDNNWLVNIFLLFDFCLYLLYFNINL